MRLAQGARTGSLPEIAHMLKEIPLLAPLDDAACMRLADGATTILVPAGEQLFQQGERGDAMFVISRGAVEILVESPAGLQLVDVLGGGDILGEMALLTGEPRTATVRAATPVTLIRVGRAAFDDLMDGNAALREAVWDGFAQRRFDNYLLTIPGFAHLDRQARAAWVRHRPHLVLDAGEVAEAAEGTHWLFVLTGCVRTVGYAHDHVAPALIRVQDSRAVACREASRVVQLPAPGAAG